MFKICEFITLIFIVSITGMAFAGTMVVTTNHGYFIYNGQVTSYYNLPNGNYQIDNSLSYVETNDSPSVAINRTALNAYMCTSNPNQPQC